MKISGMLEKCNRSGRVGVSVDEHGSLEFFYGFADDLLSNGRGFLDAEVTGLSRIFEPEGLCVQAFDGQAPLSLDTLKDFLNAFDANVHICDESVLMPDGISVSEAFDVFEGDFLNHSYDSVGVDECGTVWFRILEEVVE